MIATKLIAAAVVAMLTTACMPPSVTRSHQAQVKQWKYAPPAAPGDPFAGATTLDRDALVDAVLVVNPDVTAARAAWGAALAQVPQRASLMDPVIRVGTAPLSLGTPMAGRQASIAQRLPVPGTLRLEGAVALAEADAVGHGLDVVRRDLAWTASHLFDDYYVVHRALEINEVHRRLVYDFERIASARFAAGQGTLHDPLQAEAAQAALHRRHIALETRKKVVRAQLNALLHREPTDPLPPPPEHLAAAVTPTVFTAEGALGRRAELRAATSRLQARRHAVSLARRSVWPDVSLSTAYSSMWPHPDHRWMVGAQLNVPIQWGRRLAAVREAQSRRQFAEAKRKSVEDKVRLEIFRAKAEVDAQQKILEIYDAEVLPPSRARVTAAQAGFESGRSSFLALIEAEQALLADELGYHEALADMHRRLADLDRAAGKLAGRPATGDKP